MVLQAITFTLVSGTVAIMLSFTRPELHMSGKGPMGSKSRHFYPLAASLIFQHKVAKVILEGAG
jgi:hypothetical protein